MFFRDRTDAGRQLAEQLHGSREERPLVLALPRGGVPVGAEVARALDAPLDVWVVRKVGVPWAPELGVGAVAEGGVLFLDPEGLARVGISAEDLQDVVHAQRREVQERVSRYRRGHPAPRLAGRALILVDDGIATGGTVHAALQALRARRPGRIVLAVPVAATQSLELLAPLVDELVCVQPPARLRSIGDWYEDFREVSDDEVVRLLSQDREQRRAGDEVAETETHPG